MAIKFPDILENQNPNFALVDSFQFRGNSYPINNIENTGSIPSDKRKEGVIVFVTGSGDFYGFKGTGSGEWDVAANWTRFSSDSGSIDILNNTDNFVLTATGNSNQVKGNASFVFDGANLGIGGASAGARFEVNDAATGADLMLIKNSTNNGIKVQSDGVLQILEFSALPTAVDGGLAYSSSNFYIGL